MLQQLRNPYWMKWGMWVVLGLTIPSFVAFYGFSNVGQGGTHVAVGTLITVEKDGEKHELGKNDLLAARSDAANYYYSIAAAIVPDPNQIAGLRREVYEALGSNPKLYAPFAVADVALQDRLQKLGIRVTDAQVSEYLRNQGVTQANFAQHFGRQTQYEVAANIRATLQTESAERTVNSMARTSLLELWQEYCLREERITASYASVPVETDPNATITEEQLKAKYDALVAAESPIVLEAEKRVYEYVALRLPPRSMPIPTEEQILAAYDAASATDPQFAQEAGYVVRQILISPEAGVDDATARSQAQTALSMVSGGANFGNVADTFSLDLRNLEFTDPETSPTMRGGLLGYALTGNEVDAWGSDYMEFLKTASAGDISRVLKTPQGYAVVKLEEKRGEGKKPLADVRSILETKLRTELQEKAAKDREAQTAANLAAMRKARRSETTIQGIARAVNAEVQTTSPTLSSMNFIAGVGNLTREAESLRRLRAKRASEPLTTTNGDIVVLNVLEVIPPTNRPLDSIRTRIEQQVRTDMAADLALAKAKELRTRLETNSSDSLTSAAAEMSIEWGNLEPFARQSVPDKLNSAPEASTQLIAARKGDIILLRGGTPDVPIEYLVVKINDVSEPSKVDFLRDMQELERDLLAAKRKGYLEDFRRDAQTAFSVSYNPDFIGPEQQTGK